MAKHLESALECLVELITGVSDCGPADDNTSHGDGWLGIEMPLLPQVLLESIWKLAQLLLVGGDWESTYQTANAPEAILYQTHFASIFIFDGSKPFRREGSFPVWCLTNLSLLEKALQIGNDC